MTAFSIEPRGASRANRDSVATLKSQLEKDYFLDSRAAMRSAIRYVSTRSVRAKI
jgi:hypothetical protein